MEKLVLFVPSLEQLRDYQARHLITVRTRDDLIIANYTARAMYDRVWDEVTRICRGLILRLDRPWPEGIRIEEVVALPFEKFFNVGETGEEIRSPIIEMTEKFDGCLGLLYRHVGAYRVATRGSFAGPQALWATTFVQRFDLRALPENLTLLFEIIYPGSRIVVDYGGREDVVLLGVRDRVTGEDWFTKRVADLGASFGLTSARPTATIGSVAEALEASVRLGPNEEGWVIRCADGQRWKVKGEAYRQLHRLLSRVSERAVLDAIAGGTIDELLDAVPEYYRPTVSRWKERIDRMIAENLDRLVVAFAAAPKTMRKDFALWVTRHHRADAPSLFFMLEGKDPRPLIYKNLRETLATDPLVEPDEGGGS